MYHAALVRVAQMYVSSRAVAEDVVQETWLAVLNGIDRFEGRSSLKTWIFRILTNRAKTRGQREGRSRPVLLARAGRVPCGDRRGPLLDGDDPSGRGWAAPPASWVPRSGCSATETRE